jgi:hypothetical protein
MDKRHFEVNMCDLQLNIRRRRANTRRLGGDINGRWIDTLHLEVDILDLEFNIRDLRIDIHRFPGDIFDLGIDIRRL